MFKFLKEKLKSAIGLFSKKVEEEAEEKVVKVVPEVKKDKVIAQPEKPKESSKPVTTKVKEPAEKEKPVKVTPKATPSTKKHKPTAEIKSVEKKEMPKEVPVLYVEPEEVKVTTPPSPPSLREEIIPKKEEIWGKGFFSKLKQKLFKPGTEEKVVESVPEVTKEKVIAQHEKVVEEKLVEKPKQPVEEKEEKKGIFTKVTEFVTKTTLSEDKFNDLFWDLEMVLLENNVAVEVIDLIKKNLKEELVEKKFQRGKTEEVIEQSLKNSIDQLFDIPSINLLQEIKKKKPYVIVFVGINGSGKTTSIAKVTKLLLTHNLSCVIAAGDTFRAAAIQQLEEHAKNLKVKLIRHDYGSDPAAVCFDALKYAEAKNIDVVLIDTAGRLHSNVNLMDEMKKIVRVAKPDLKIFVGEALTGNDCCDQIREFNEAVGIDGIILTKADVDEKGGAMISASYVSKKPILYLGVGQEYADLKPFDKSIVLESLEI